MMQVADRSQLIASFALQMRFISQDQFHAAMSTWNHDKSHRLDEILLEHESLDRETHELLVAVVEKHLKLHGGKEDSHFAPLPGAALSADEPPTIVPTANGLRLAAAFDDPLGTIQADSGNWLCYSGRLRMTGPPNQGGMGQVSAALDEQLNREVALKEIKDEYSDDADCRVRFIQEAEITGGLEHPGIVPVYALGRYPDGRPFYAMRFIRGSSLQQAIDHFHSDYDSETDRAKPADRMKSPMAESRCRYESIEFRKLLGRFIDVCNAMEYAHSRGVIHRDLKPSNIMLGKFGETLVVDWGLAKVTGRADTFFDTGEKTLRPSSGSGSTPTQMGQAHGTPAYMPPEQAVGKLDEIGTRSDVYSLGATLYCLLTGKAPFSGATAPNILYRVRTGDFVRPQEVNFQVPRALEAVCLRAMAVDPSNRYASAEALADDVERYLAAGPAAARVEKLANPPQGGWQKWAYHNPLMATVILSLIPNGVLSIANVWFDGNIVLDSADVLSVKIFWGVLIFWKVFLYGCGTAAALCLVLPMFWALQGQAPASALPAARRKCLELGELIFWVSVVCWTAAGFLFPACINAVLYFFDSSEGPDLKQYAHFFVVHVLFGVVSGAIVLSSLSYVSVRLFYPQLLQLSGPIDVRADGLLERSRRIDRYSSLVVWIAFLSLIYLNVLDLDGDYKLAIMVLMCLGLGSTYMLAVKAIPEVKADLDALARSPVAFASFSTDDAKRKH